MIKPDNKIYSNLARQLLQNDNTALMVVDVQEKYCSPYKTHLYFNYDETMITTQKIQSLSSEFRKASVPIFAVYYDSDNVGPDFYEFQPKPEDTLIRKSGNSAFKDEEAQTHEILKSRGINNLLICGFNRSACIWETALHARKNGYKTFILDDLTGDNAFLSYKFNKDVMNVIFNSHGIKVINAQDLLEHLQNPAYSAKPQHEKPIFQALKKSLDTLKR